MAKICSAGVFAPPPLNRQLRTPPWIGLKQQYQNEEKVTTSNDGRPSHVSIQLYDKCCNALKDYMYQCQGLRTEKEQQLDRFCTAWEDLKWERDSFAKEIRRRDRCGEGVIHKIFAKKLRSGKYWDHIH